MTYAEKADIAAKAVKVLDSVTMRRHEKIARVYSKKAKMILELDSEWGLAVRVSSAVENMAKRLDKPRYRLVDGEWVKPPATEKQIRDEIWRNREADRAQVDVAMTQAAMNRELYGSQQNNMGIGQAMFGPQVY